MSDSIVNLTVALLAAQDNFGPVLKNCNNPYFGSKYADMASIKEATEEALAQQGLTLIQMPASMVTADGTLAVGCTSMLTHISGEYISSTCYLPLTKQDPQQAGSAITYCKRYSASALLWLAAEDDDDAEGAMSRSDFGPAVVVNASDDEDFEL